MKDILFVVNNDIEAVRLYRRYGDKVKGGSVKVSEKFAFVPTFGNVSGVKAKTIVVASDWIKLDWGGDLEKARQWFDDIIRCRLADKSGSIIFLGGDDWHEG